MFANLVQNLGVKGVEGLLVEAAMHEHSDDLPLLLPLELKLRHLVERVNVILRRHEQTILFF